MAMARRIGAENDAVVETATRYLGVLFARENLAVRQAALGAIEGHAHRAAKLRELGVIARHDEQRADVALAEAQRDVLDATQQLRLAETALRSLLPELGDIPVLTDTLYLMASQRSAEEWVAQCAQGNPSLLQLRSARNAMHEKGNVSFGNYLPTVYGFGMVNLFDHYMIEKAEPKWAVGVGASFILFDGFRRSNEHQQIAMESAAVEASVRESERKLSLLVRSTLMNAALAAEQYAALETARAQAEENIRLNARRFDEGLGTSLELIDAQLSWKAIMLRRTRAMYDRAIALLTLHALRGDAPAFVRAWSEGAQGE
jgi:outer membrane protein TolC